LTRRDCISPSIRIVIGTDAARHALGNFGIINAVSYHGRNVHPFAAYRWYVGAVFAVLAFAALLVPFPAAALTIRTKADLRMWETVMDRTSSLSWPWEDRADAASLTFSNRLTHAVSSVVVEREAGARRGTCPQPALPAAEEGLVVATLVQTAGGVEVARATACLAYVQGAAAQPITVRTKAGRDWWRVGSPQIAAFDARWWNMAGPSGHDVLWAVPPGWHRVVVRELEDVGVVDEPVLRFGDPGCMFLLR